MAAKFYGFVRLARQNLSRIVRQPERPAPAILFRMIPDKVPKDRRHDTERRLRYAIRKANDRMFAILRTPAERDKPSHEPRHRPS